MTHVSIKNLTKVYPGLTVPSLDNLSLEINSGSLTALLGPSGCGKTTTMKMIAGLLDQTSGDVTFDGTSILKEKPENRGVVMVFQNHLLFPYMNVQDNIGFGLKMRNVHKDEIFNRVIKMLDLVKLPNMENRMPKELSGGQQQRVALARALIVQPRVLLLDEPLSNLDAHLRFEMRDLIRNLQQSMGITTIFVTHDQEEAMTMSDRIAVMDHGNILQVSPPKEIYNRPKNKFVSQFIGNINILDTEINSSSSDNLNLEVEGFGSVSLKNNYNFNKTTKVYSAIRPEELLISKDDFLNNKYQSSGIIKNISFYGESTYFYVQLSNSEKVLMVSNNDQKNSFQEKEKCFVSFDPENLKLIED